MLPFLKERHEGGMSGPVEKLERKPDDADAYGMLDAVVDDLIEGLSTKNRTLVKGALEALVEHIQAEDEEQDQSEK